MKKRIKILMVLGNTGRGGAQAYAMNVLRNIDLDEFQIDFAVYESKPDGYDSEITKYGSIIHYVPRFIVINYFECLSRWEKLFSVYHYDIVEAHATNAASFFLKIARKEGIHTIAHSHSAGYRGNRIERLAKQFFSKNTKKEADYWFACSDLAALRLFGSAYKDYPHYYGIPNSIDCSLFRFDEQKRVKIRNSIHVKNELLIGHVGTFSEPKNHEFIINLFNEMIKKRGDNYRLLLLGDGALKSKIMKKTEELGITKYVTFTGTVPNVNEYMMAMDVLLFPSLFEGFPVTIIEAQASGLPCVISDVITKEVDQTDLVQRVSLDSPWEKWIDAIHAASAKNREYYNDIILRSDYDVKKSVETLMDIYRYIAK